MKSESHPEFDDILESIRKEDPGAPPVEAAGERVRAMLASGCAQFLAMMPGYREGSLSEARRLLLVDHTHECVACRKALKGEPKLVVMPAARQVAVPAYRRWAIAAALAVALGAAAFTMLLQYGPGRASGAVVEAAGGNIYLVTASGSRALAAGQRIDGRDPVRTAKGSSAILRLADGSLVEMRERSELSLTERGRDVTVRLDRGDVIVQAVKRTSGHLFVDARDCNVAVTGTIFAVSRGTKWSRVSVVEGAVRVTQGRTETLLKPGDQVATAPSMGRVPVAEEIAWSRNVDGYIALLKEFRAFERDIQNIRTPGLRYASRLLPMLPDNTVAVVSLPNLGEAIADAHRLLQDHVRSSPEMRQWFEQRAASKDLDESIERVRRFSSYLGDEVIIALTADKTGKTSEPLVLAEAAKPGLRELFESETARMGPSKLHFEMRGNVALVSPQPVAAGNGFASTPFYSRIIDAYRDGAGVLVAVDLEKLAPFKGDRGLAQAGFTNLKYLVVEQRDLAARSDTRALVTFAGPRAGITSWLASPAAMGSLDFISPEASFATAFALKSPSAALDDIFNLAGGQKGNFEKELAETESKLGISLKNDLAAALGGDMAFAVDGAPLPTPSWKLVVEVNDPARLQSAIERMVQTAGEPAKKLALGREQAGQRVYYTLQVPGGGPLMEAHYTFVDGYLVAAPNRALLDRSIQYRANGYTLPRSQGFTALLPRDRQANFSAVVYQNAGGLLGAAADVLGGVRLTPDQKKSLDKLAAETKPTLIYAYADDDRIQVASSGGVFGLGLGDLIGAGSPGGAMRMLKPRPRR